MTKYIVVRENIRNGDKYNIIVCPHRKGAEEISEKMNLHAMNTKDYTYYVREITEEARANVIDPV